MAIITRWRMPPESSCGYCVEPALRLGDAARRSAASTRLARASRAADAAMRRGSPRSIWRPIGQHRVERGHRLLEDHARSGRRAPRRISRSASAARSRPSRRIAPPAIARQRLRQQPHDRQRGHRLAASRIRRRCTSVSPAPSVEATGRRRRAPAPASVAEPRRSSPSTDEDGAASAVAACAHSKTTRGK